MSTPTPDDLNAKRVKAKARKDARTREKLEALAGRIEATVTVPMLAKIINRSEKTVHRMRRNGQLPDYDVKPSKRTRLWRISTINRFLDGKHRPRRKHDQDQENGTGNSDDQ